MEPFELPVVERLPLFSVMLYIVMALQNQNRYRAPQNSLIIIIISLKVFDLARKGDFN